MYLSRKVICTPITPSCSSGPSLILLTPMALLSSYLGYSSGKYSFHRISFSCRLFRPRLVYQQAFPTYPKRHASLQALPSFPRLNQLLYIIIRYVKNTSRPPGPRASHILLSLMRGNKSSYMNEFLLPIIESFSPYLINWATYSRSNEMSGICAHDICLFK